MPRKLRVEYPGAIYHVMSRGNGKQDIFLGDVDRHDFVKSVAEVCEKTGFQVHAYCLMSNHFHLVVETPDANLVAGMSWLLSAYSLRFNRRHRLVGHLFSGRYKSLIVEGSGDGYLKTVCDYVHLNPARANLLAPAQRLLEYPWSSFGGYLAGPGLRPAWIRVDRLLGEHGIREDTAEGRREFERQIEARRLEGMDEQEASQIRQGWFLGSPEFKEELLGRMEGKLGEHHSGELKRQGSVEKAERIIQEELAALGWTEEDLRARRKSDPAKLAMAARLRRETTLTLPRVAERLSLGSWKSATVKLRRWQRDNKK